MTSVIVGVGASAGGLEAFTQLLSALPIDTGMAFVLVQHLEPKHESVLTILLSRSTKMPVQEVREAMQVEANHVYVIPANADMSVLDGLLHVETRKATAGRHLPIDHFLTSLAQARGPKAIGVILSGTASDGTAGIKAIKEAGGITFAQSPESAKFDGMPRNAIASGCVDLVLPPERIARELTRIAHHPFAGILQANETPHLPAMEDEWARLFHMLRKARGVDFSLYKQSTVKRRLARRMAVCKAESVAAYLKVVERKPAELDALFDELLILVTEFFRDSEVFAALRNKVAPRILSERPAGEAVRIWVAGCSTGEEAYSIAIVLLECLGESFPGAQIQIFGTDVSDDAIGKARLGIYSAADVKGLSPERLRRSFTAINGSYQVNQAIREVCLFARHDLTRDPPFSKLDMISCRNVLIYMEPALQKRILAGFHWALKGNGVLLLGKTESLGTHTDLFTATDRKNKFFRKSVGTHAPFGMTHPSYDQALPVKPLMKDVPLRTDVEREADLALWDRSGYAGLVVSNDLQILHVRGDTSPYIRLVPGKATLQLMRALREEIMLEVRSALQKARRGDRAVRSEGIEIRHDGNISVVNIEVRPLIRRGLEKSFLILFERAHTKAAEKEAGRTRGGKLRREGHEEEVTRLREELARTRDYVQAIIRDQEASNEELKTANEEALSSMEELQSTNEELETAKEELQSSNEELVTLNEQLQNRNSELAQLSNDLGNVLSGIDIPVVILDAERRIRRFTLPAEKLLGLIQGDIGRPIGKLRIGLNIPDLDALITTAIGKAGLAEQDVQAESGRWYQLRIHPFIQSDEKVQGVLMSFVDVDVAKKLQKTTVERAEHSESIVRALLETTTQAVLAVDWDGRIKLANAAAEAMFGYTREVLLSKPLESLMPERFRAVHVRHRAAWFARPHNRPMGIGLELAGLRKDGSEFPIEVSLSFIEGGGLGAAFITDITERKKQEGTLISFRNQLAAEVAALQRLHEATERLWRMHDLREGLEEMIDAGKDLLGAEFGNIQLLNAEKQVLEIAAQRGFGANFLQHFREVSTEDSSACGRSLKKRERIVIEDVNTDARYAPHRAIAAATGYRAVQSAPLFGTDGKPIGMFSMYFRNPRRPSEEELARFDSYANLAAQFIERVRADQQLQRMGGKLLSAQEAGNREIARELHDVFSQELAAVGMELSSLKEELKTDSGIADRITRLSETIGKLSDEIHRTSRELHPAILEDLGLEPALRQECDSFQQRTGIHAEFQAAKMKSKIGPEAALCLYRIAQESLQNVQKHSKSPRVVVQLENGKEGITLRVQDAGKGFNAEAAARKGGLGLISMEERVRLVNGKLTIESHRGKGTTVAAFIPRARK